MPNSKSQAVYKDKNGAISADKINLVDNSSATPTFIQLQINPDGQLSFYRNGATQIIPTLTLSNTGGSTGGTPTTPTTPPVTLPATSVYQDGNAIVNSDGTSTTPFAEVRSPVGSSTVTATGGKYVFNYQGVGGQQMGLNLNGSGQNIRRLKFKINVATTANLANENTLVHIWTGPSTNLKDFFQIRLIPDFDGNTNKYSFVLKMTLNGDFATGYTRRIFIPFTKGTEYQMELYMTDGLITFTDVNKTSGFGTLTNWFNQPDQGIYSPFSYAGKYFDNIWIGEFYGGNLSGQLTLDDIKTYQDYVYPIVPATDAAKIANAWAGFKNRWSNSSGAIFKEDGRFPTDPNGIFRSQTVSESQAYGMMIAAQLNDKTFFDLVHTYNQTYLRRSVITPTPSPAIAMSHLGWLANPVTNVVTDTGTAPDADIDIALAYIWANERWGSTGAINYSLMATQILADLKTYSFIDYKGSKIVDGGNWNYPNITREINISYQSPGSFKKFQDFTGDAFWGLARDGAYKIAQDSGDETLTGKTIGDVIRTRTGAGVIPNWVRVNGSNDQLSGPNLAYSIDHTYDAFRFEHRAYWDHLWTGDPRFATFAAYKLKTIYEGDWSSKRFIEAEKAHDNSLLTNSYSKGMFTTKAWAVLSVANSPIAPAVKNTITSTALYSPHPTGATFKDVGYFGEAWDIIFQMTQAGLWRYTNS